MVLAFGFLIILSASSLSASADWKIFAKNHVNLSPVIPRIIGGNEAAPHEYPFQVGLLINGNSFCGGSLVSTNYVLTAAHCAIAIGSVDIILGAHNITADEDTQIRLSAMEVHVHEQFSLLDYQYDLALLRFIGSVDIILGAHNITADEDTQIRLSAMEVHVHEQFSLLDYQYDIALLRLSETVTLNDYIQTIRLPSRSAVNERYENEIVTSTGWGLTGDLDHDASLEDISPVLMTVDVMVQTLEECGDYYNHNIYNISYVTEINVCTNGYKNKGTCNGDSGGPLVHNGIQIGLVSIGTTLCELCSPSIFTNIAKHLDWIEEHSDLNT